MKTVLSGSQPFRLVAMLRLAILRRIGLIIWFLLVWVLFNSVYAQQRPASNVLYSYKPLPVYLGLEIGTGLTFWQNATPTFFATNYPYSDRPDTIHTWFPSGATPLFGFFIGGAIDFPITTNVGVIGKFNYNERRGSWHSVATTECDMQGSIENVPVTNDITLMLRDVSVEGYLRWKLAKLHDLYLGAGLAMTIITSDHYDLSQSIGGSPDCSFMDFGTGQGTGIKAYSIGGSLDRDLRTMFGELKLLAGYPLRVGYRWVLSPEVTLGIPFTPIFRPSAQAAYDREHASGGVSPVTVTGLLSLKYQIR